jgi:hypothetical protein
MITVVGGIWINSNRQQFEAEKASQRPCLRRIRRRPTLQLFDKWAK